MPTAEPDAEETRRHLESSDALGLTPAGSSRPIGAAKPTGAPEPFRPLGRRQPFRRLRSPYGRRLQERGGKGERFERNGSPEWIERWADRRAQRPDIEPIRCPPITVGPAQRRP